VAARRHDAHTTKTPQAMVPARVMHQVRCHQCGFIFFGTPGNRCEICRAKEVQHEAPATLEGPTTDAAASGTLVTALDRLRSPQEDWRPSLEARLVQVERQAQALLEEVAGLRQVLQVTRERQGGPR
jgi:hypothetical protein